MTLPWLIAVLAAAAGAGWALLGIGTIREFPKLPLFDPARPRPPERWPRLSVVVAACNEVDTIEPALRTLLAQDYPGLEVIVVDDRSTDGTGEILDRLAREDERLVVRHVRELPPGWLGKVHALDFATRAASGELVLYTDADVHFGPGALRDAVALFLERGLDHLAILPRTLSDSFWLDVLMATAGTALLRKVRAAAIQEGAPDAAMGVGAFNLVRTSALAKTPGFAWLRLEVIDDLGLARMLLSAGAKTGLAISRERIKLTWYASVGAMVRGLEKNLFGAAARFEYGRAALAVAGLAVLPIAPALGLFALGSPVPAWLAVAPLVVQLVSLVVSALVVHRIWQTPIIPSIAAPFGVWIIAFALARSAFLAWRRGGILWRGTLYPLAALREGQRMKL